MAMQNSNQKYSAGSAACQAVVLLPSAASNVAINQQGANNSSSGTGLGTNNQIIIVAANKLRINGVKKSSKKRHSKMISNATATLYINQTIIIVVKPAIYKTLNKWSHRRKFHALTQLIMCSSRPSG